MMLTTKKVWSEGLHKLGKIEQTSISPKLIWRNIKLITELDLLGLLAYQVRTWIMGIDSLRLNKSVISMKMLAWTG